MSDLMSYKVLKVLLLLMMSSFVVSCGNAPDTAVVTTDTATTTTDTTTTTTPTTTTTTTAAVTTPTSLPTKVVMSASLTSVKSDSSDVSTLTATVLDSGNAAVANATVLFSASGGVLGSASAVTDTAGQATVTFTAGVNKINQVVTITATLSGVTPEISTQLPIQVVGSTVSLTTINTNITDDGLTTDVLSISVKDAGNGAVYNEPVTISQSGTGAVTLTASSANTDINGTVLVNVVGTNSGTVTVSVAAAGSTATQDYVVSTTGTAFGVVSPTVDPYALSASVELPIVVNVPAGITTVTFATSLGGLSLVSAGVKTSTVDATVVGGTATAYLTSINAGVANIQVFDKAVPTTSDNISVAVFQPSTAATQISLQSNVNVVSPSTGGVFNIATLTATVRDVNGQVVGDAPVLFSIPSPTGGGETVSPVIVFTDSQGQAQTTFTSGSTSSASTGVVINANVLSPAIGPATTNIVIGGTAGSVVIGYGTKIVELSAASYQLPMTVLVADSNGNAVANAVVTLKAWPSFYSFGFWKSPNLDSTNCVALTYPTAVYPTGSVPNEDINRNLIIDPLEDQTHTVTSLNIDVYGNITLGGVLATPANDGILTPANSAAGTLPATVTTDTNGVANFNLTYLKQHGAWITDEITASTQVLGTEATGRIEFKLSVLNSDAATCVLPNSPFNEGAW